jgi:hypothetical protein
VGRFVATIPWLEELIKSFWYPGIRMRKYGNSDPGSFSEPRTGKATAPEVYLTTELYRRTFETQPATDRRNIVVRDIRDRNGSCLGAVVERHDGTEAGIITAAQRATDRMYADYPEASNIESRIGATDATGKPRWSISPNFSHLAEIGTDEAAYIWGDVTSRAI